MCDGLLYGYKQNRRGEWFAGAASQTQSPKRLMRVARLHQQSSHRQQHSCCSRATSPYLLTFLPFPSPPCLLFHPTQNAEAGAIAICLACISSLHHLGWLAVLPQEAPLSRVIALVGSAALPSLLLQVRARWRPSFHFAAQLCLLLRYNRQLRSCCKSQTNFYSTLEPPHHP